MRKGWINLHFYSSWLVKLWERGKKCKWKSILRVMEISRQREVSFDGGGMYVQKFVYLFQLYIVVKKWFWGFNWFAVMNSFLILMNMSLYSITCVMCFWFSIQRSFTHVGCSCSTLPNLLLHPFQDK